MIRRGRQVQGRSVSILYAALCPSGVSTVEEASCPLNKITRGQTPSTVCQSGHCLTRSSLGLLDSGPASVRRTVIHIPVHKVSHRVLKTQPQPWSPSRSLCAIFADALKNSSPPPPRSRTNATALLHSLHRPRQRALLRLLLKILLVQRKNPPTLPPPLQIWPK